MIISPVHLPHLRVIITVELSQRYREQDVRGRVHLDTLDVRRHMVTRT